MSVREFYLDQLPTGELIDKKLNLQQWLKQQEHELLTLSYYSTQGMLKSKVIDIVFMLEEMNKQIQRNRETLACVERILRERS